MTKCHETPTKTVVRTMRFPVRADVDVNKELVKAGHVQREAYNQAIESQFKHRGRVDSLYKRPKEPKGLLGQLTQWRAEGKVHGLVALQRPAVRAAREACKRAWAHETDQANRIVGDMTVVEEWNEAHPEWCWGEWDRIGAEGRKATPKKDRPPLAKDRFRDQRQPPDDKKRFRSAKKGMRSVISDLPPTRVDARTLRVHGIDADIVLKCPKGLPPKERLCSIRIVPRGTERDMRKPEKLRFEAHVSVEIDVVEIAEVSETPISIDLGVDVLSALSTGEMWSPPVDEVAQARLKKTQEVVNQLAKEKRQGTKVWKKAIVARRKARRAVEGAIREAMRQYARSLAERYRWITVEALKVKAMTASARGRGMGVAAKRGLNRALQARRFAMFISMLKVALENRGGTLLALPAAYSSMTCAKCGHVSKKNRKGRKFRCVECEHENHADVNAAGTMLVRTYIYLAVVKGGGTHQDGLDAVWECIARAREAVRDEAGVENQVPGEPANSRSEQCAHTTPADEGKATGRGAPAKRLASDAAVPPPVGEHVRHAREHAHDNEAVAAERGMSD